MSFLGLNLHLNVEQISIIPTTLPRLNGYVYYRLDKNDKLFKSFVGENIIFMFLLYNKCRNGEDYMQRFNSLINTTVDTKLESLLTQRKAPLSEDGMKKILEELTLYMAGDRRFYIAFYPKEDAIKNDTIQASDIDRVDLMQATDDEKYLPIFSTLEGLRVFKPTLQEDEHIYVVTKQDVLDFLNMNAKVAAAVLNPLADDLLLYRMQLQNLIQVQAEQL